VEIEFPARRAPGRAASIFVLASFRHMNILETTASERQTAHA
jgi:hypothetical protein